LGVAEVMIVQHVDCEKPGLILRFLEENGIAVGFVRGFDGQKVPREMGNACGLVVMGGPMGVYESGRYPYLVDEMRLIESALRESKPVLGVCLGSQLLASALGSPVTKGRQKEIGWFPVALRSEAAADALWHGVERSFTALHWHGDVFDLPRGAVHLASSELTACQAFCYGRNAYGLLFHIEATAETLAGMTEAFPEELAEACASGRQILEQSRQRLPQLEQIAHTVFGRWVGLVR
jgi:GMP synthase (glutamine-hydrolysing)